MQQTVTKRIEIPYDVRLPITHNNKSYMCYFGEWLFIVDYTIEKCEIDYSLFSASFTKSDLFSEDIKPLNVFLSPSDIDELILHKIILENEDEFTNDKNETDLFEELASALKPPFVS